jgi:catechol 2,3-dioxygenase-like lactoylglutathione lyase family enzyme
MRGRLAAPMSISGMNHFTVLTNDLDASKAFYIDLLGLTEGFRPDLGFPGAWLYAGGQAVLHIVAGRGVPAQPRGVIDHMAFSARDLRAVAARLTEHNIKYDLRRLPSTGAWQLFCLDPSGARVELDFEATEDAP